MSNDKKTDDAPVVTIKKYANRRLYNTGNSAYVTLEDLAEMVKRGEDFVVFDAKSSEDITRSVLTQIIFEQEGKGGQSLLPITFLRQLIRFYGDSMQMVVPSYLDFSISKLADEQQKLREQMANAFQGHAKNNPTLQMFGSLEEHARANMALFNKALSIFNPFLAANAGGAAPAPGAGDDIDAIRREVGDLQKRLEGLARKA